MGIKLVKAKDNSAHFSRGELYKVTPYKTMYGETKYNLGLGLVIKIPPDNDFPLFVAQVLHQFF